MDRCIQFSRAFERGAVVRPTLSPSLEALRFSDNMRNSGRAPIQSGAMSLYSLATVKGVLSSPEQTGALVPAAS